MCVQRVMVYGSETWPIRAEELRRLERGENDDKMDVRNDIEGEMQERGIEEAFGN